ncbi:NIPSNAP family containing protein [Pontibacter diazotrophicus]|uniref:NIPSNAP family containing protein n=1 Tax=Pontibacter diazotrophicus TaxID=1400979 RepID=A0A3D8LF11_9BACT|nr:NIPSNAP family protein [Pontibacter diazotrophicus]RDV16031.1 NIPSNAP family containing protein [Pontibacter diazotrophicus]
MNYKKLNLFALCLLVLWVVNAMPALSQAAKPNLQQLKIFHLENKSQEERLDNFLQNAYLPALHRAGISQVGVFKPAENTDANAPAPTEQLVYVLIPFSSPDQAYTLDATLANDKQYTAAGKDYIDAPHNNPLYSHFETILLDAFVGMKGVSAPKLKSASQERIYELRSYEAATEKLHQNKVDMFNKGEIQLFDRLGFNAVFYGRVLAGSKMPNLMYMTTFENMAERDKKWKAFGADPEWKKMSAMPEYANNVSHADIYLLHPTEYSDI